MNTDRLDKLVAWKAGLSLTTKRNKDIITSVRPEVLLDISKRYPWSFLERKSELITLSADDTIKELPPDFLRIIGVALIDSDDVVHPVYSAKPLTWEEEHPDQTHTDSPYRYWLEWNTTTGRPWIVLKPKSDGSYTLRIRYQKKILADQVSLIPDGLVPFYGMMLILEKNVEQITIYKNLYEGGIKKMWASDMPDLNDTPDLKPGRAIENFNIYMDGLIR